ncbi:MAG: inositol monophosphatase [Spirochaetia bacterium]|nr:inositol monophosphatase [Spirochaetia bacterium]
MIENLVEKVIHAGDYAADMQHCVTRNFKADGTVVTEVDMHINKTLGQEIRKLFPDANLVTEEEKETFDPDREYTFVLDPLDGTDAYSMGMPCWCVSLGLLKGSVPVAGIVYAPTWGLRGGTLIYADLKGDVSLNGHPVEKICKDIRVPQIMIPSSIHHYFDWSSFPGKIRGTGSAVIGISSLLIHSQIIGAVINRCYVWDIAAPHAIIKRLGFDLEYFSGESVDYDNLVYRNKMKDYLICGTSDAISKIRENFKRIL